MAEIELKWKGKTYIIPEKDAFVVGEKIEDLVTITQLQTMNTDPKFHKLARAFCIMLQHVGVRVTPQEVHTAMMDDVKAIFANGGKHPDEAKQLVAAAAVGALLAVLMDGAPEAEGGDDASGNSKAASSNGRTKRR